MSVDYGLITESTDTTVVGGATDDNSKFFRNIRIALESQFKTMADDASITTRVFENVDFDFSSLEKSNLTNEFVRGTILPGDTLSAGVGTTGRDLHQGIFQIDYYNRVGIGAYSDKIDSIANAFKKGHKLVVNDTTVNVRNVSLGVGRRDGAFFVRNIDVSYFAVTTARS